MKLLRSLCMALSMYSKIPVPRVEWKEENMAYAMCFFPLVGAFIGLFLMLWFMLTKALGFGSILTAAFAAILPMLISGGIHMDGFCDTLDALNSHASREKMLEIMKDSCSGAGAVMGSISYMIMYFALWTQVGAGSEALLVLIAVPMLARGYSALGVVTFKSARGNGLLASFKSAADVKTVRIAAVIWIVVTSAYMVWRDDCMGIACAAAALVMFVIYRVMAYRKFGGTTGDAAGWFVEMCQLICLAAVVAAQAVGGII